VGQNWTDKTPWAVKIIYLVAFPTGSEPKIIFAPRKLGRLV
jgi:hypothetical protein